MKQEQMGCRKCDNALVIIGTFIRLKVGRTEQYSR